MCAAYYICYTKYIKPFYVTGFLYNLKTQQILLLKSQSNENTVSNWSMFGGESKEGEEGKDTFSRIVYKLMGLNLNINKIYPIYDYFHETLNKVNFVFYAEVDIIPDPNSLKESALSWVTFHETLKFLFAAHAKQDMIVGQRVIHLKEREEEAIRAVIQY